MNSWTLFLSYDCFGSVLPNDICSIIRKYCIIELYVISVYALIQSLDRSWRIYSRRERMLFDCYTLNDINEIIDDLSNRGYLVSLNLNSDE